MVIIWLYRINTKIGGINSKTNAKIIYDCICQNGIVIGMWDIH